MTDVRERANPAASPARTLWRDEAGGRFYLVPDGVDPGTGSLVLRSGATRVLHADPSAVAPYQVSRDEGLAFMAARVDAFVDCAQSRAESWLERVAPRSSPAASPPSAEGPPEHGPGVKFVAAVTGQTEEQLTASPEALLRGVGKLFEHAAEAVAEARTGEERREAVLARLRAMGTRPRATGD